MTLRVGTTKAEGFTARFALRDEATGLMIVTHPDILFAGKADRTKVMEQFKQFVAALEALGVTVLDKEKIML